MPDTDAFPVLWFGAMKARACAVPVNTRLAPPEIAAIVRDSGASVLLFGQEFADVVNGMRDECPDLRTLVLVEAGRAGLPGFRRVNRMPFRRRILASRQTRTTT